MSKQKKTINLLKDFLLLFFGDDESGITFVERYEQYDTAIEVVESGRLDWRAPCAIGIHVLVRLLLRDHLRGQLEKEPDSEDVTDHLSKVEIDLANLGQSATEPLIRFAQVLESEKESSSEGYELVETLFFTRFALGFLYLASEQNELAKPLFHDVAATRVSYRRGVYRSREGILEAKQEITRGKRSIATFAAPMYAELTEDYEESLFWIIEAAACSYSGSLNDETVELIDKWLEQCSIRADAESYTNLLDLLGGLIEVTELATRQEKRPSEYPITSSQYFAWKFGNIVSKLSHMESKLANGDTVSYYLFEAAMEGYMAVSPAVASLLLPPTDAQSDHLDYWRDRITEYEALFSYNHSYQPAYLEAEPGTGQAFACIGPDNGLYWATRIGYADAELKSASTQTTTVKQLDKRDSVVESNAIRGVKIDQTTQRTEAKLNEFMRDWEYQHAAPERVREELANLPALKDTWKYLPLEVTDRLMRAELYYRSHTQHAEAKVEYAKAVEASWQRFFVEPLVIYIRKGKTKKIPLYPEPWRNFNPLSPNRLRRLSLSQWGNALERIADPLNEDLANAVKAIWPRDNLSSLSELSKYLSEVMQYRSGSAHHQSAEKALSETELAKLEKLRNLVLGKGPSSILSQIVETFRLVNK